MTWEGRARENRLPKDWAKRRTQVLKRDNYQCQIRDPTVCIIRANQCDHIVAGDNHEYDNLQAACEPCHDRKTSAEGNAKKARMRAARKRPTEKHPGWLY